MNPTVTRSSFTIAWRSRRGRSGLGRDRGPTFGDDLIEEGSLRPPGVRSKMQHEFAHLVVGHVAGLQRRVHVRTNWHDRIVDPDTRNGDEATISHCQCLALP